ncbi:hypothetical protein U8Q05_36740 (plasmid) [Rhizobium ruizarguesonis]|nr:hypothetical protein U8Q05_36740 [Rhizobium ruizarguesonis]
MTFENRLTSIAIWSLAFVAAVMFAADLLPALPPFDVRKGRTPPELPLATPWYFLPKSVEILFQQPLVVVLVLTLSARHSASSSRLRGRALALGVRDTICCPGRNLWVRVSLSYSAGAQRLRLFLRPAFGILRDYGADSRIVVVGTESFLGFMIRDNLTLNILQLPPSEAISRWQLDG